MYTFNILVIVKGPIPLAIMICLSKAPHNESLTQTKQNTFEQIDIRFYLSQLLSWHWGTWSRFPLWHSLPCPHQRERLRKPKDIESSLGLFCPSPVFHSPVPCKRDHKSCRCCLQGQSQGRCLKKIYKELDKNKKISHLGMTSLGGQIRIIQNPQNHQKI